MQWLKHLVAEYTGHFALASSPSVLLFGGSRSYKMFFYFLLVYSLSLICQPDIRGHEAPHHHHVSVEKRLERVNLGTLPPIPYVANKPCEVSVDVKPNQ